MYSLPPDHLERVYAGVLGKVIGVYLGRPFEMWSHQKILKELGVIEYYVHDKLKVPCVVVDDDISGTFGFVRALEEHGNLTSEKIGKTWLNSVVENKAVFWWGGRGISTEHTAYYNLRHGVPAPHSGSIATNGTTVAEQIGAQIFIDGWALASPGQPELAVKLAEMAGKVSHDGESVYAAMLWAAMEAEAFLSKDVDHLLDTGLRFIPHDSLIATGIRQVRAWVAEDGDWLLTRQRIEDRWGYDKFHGVCHVVPNHLIMVMSLLYGGDDFDTAMKIINTCGWDTDCNSGNVGCLVAIMHGMDSFSGKDWRGPIADQAIISTADGGYSMNTCTRITYDLTNMGRKLAGKAALPPPKDGAQYHFTLPGSVQGFRASQGQVSQDAMAPHGPALAIDATAGAEVMTQTSATKDFFNPNLFHAYPLCATPLVYSGQTFHATVVSASSAKIALRLKYYDLDENLVSVDGEAVTLDSSPATIKWTLPPIPDSLPIAELGLVVLETTGKLWLDRVWWTGAPDYTIDRPSKRSRFWDHAWMSDTTKNLNGMKPGVTLFFSHDEGEGSMTTGTKEWTDYQVTVQDLTPKLGSPTGLAIRVRGLNRYYALVFTADKSLAIIKAFDEQRIILKSVPFNWTLDTPYEFHLQANGTRIVGKVGATEIAVDDDQWVSGGTGVIVSDGAVSCGAIRIQPVA